MQNQIATEDGFSRIFDHTGIVNIRLKPGSYNHTIAWAKAHADRYPDSYRKNKKTIPVIFRMTKSNSNPIQV